MASDAIDIADEPRRLDERAAPLARGARLAGLGALALSVVLGWLAGGEQFFRSYLVSYCYWLSLALGALFFVMLQHLTRASWSVVLRRLAETVAAALPLLGLLFLPLLIPLLTGRGRLFPWAAPGSGDALLEAKRPFLNPAFFVLRWAGYFAVWCWLARYLLALSLAQDRSGEPALTLRMQRCSAPGLILLAATLTLAAIDLLMSLAPRWYSTIFGVYYFAGSALGFVALLVVMVYLLQRAGRLRRAVTSEHYHDLGKLLFAFVFFWAYIAYSQYMLIWYANLPAETGWLAARQQGQWGRLSLLLLFGHFVLPFLALISRRPKRRRAVLSAAALWVLAAHWLDIYWLAGPRPDVPGGLVPLHLLDLTCLLGLGGLLVGAVVRGLSRHPLLPERDPRLDESLALENL